MSVSIVLGSQWGDEGKGKLVDILASSADLCCRAAGGHNAGHTIVVGGTSYDFHILPSGLINPRCEYNLIGGGTVVHIPSFFKELRTLEERGLQGVRDRVLISQRAHVCFDLHGYVDGLAEDRLKRTAGVGSVIGTTRRGIGPCYADKVGRHGVTLWMLVNGQNRWEKRLRDLESSARALYGDEALQHYDLEDEIRRMHEYRVEIKKYVIDSTNLLQTALGIKVDPAAAEAPSPKNVLIEGANALLLDIDHGTYPYVTSSNTGLAGVFSGLAGFSHKALSRPNSAVIGVVKAYTTRVGAGPFPTELGPEIAHVSKIDADYGVKLQEIGREFGVTTGRRRRCGWLDLVLLRYSMQINGYTVLNLTKLDVLDTFEEIRVAVHYKDRSTGDVHPSFPADIDQLENLEIEYKTFPGWNTKTSGTKTWDDLPQKAQEYVEYIEQQVGIPVKWIGTGPRREDMIVR